MPRRDSAEPVKRGNRLEGQQAPGIVHEQPDGGEERGHLDAGDVLHRHRGHTELFGDHPNAGPARDSQCGPDALGQLRRQGRPTTVLARSLGPRNPRVDTRPDHVPLVLRE